MTWTILVLVLGIALYVFSGVIVKEKNAKKPSVRTIYVKKVVNVIAALLMAGAVCRLYMPIYLVDTNPMILQEMITAMQEKEAEEKNKAIRKYVRAKSDTMIADAPVMGPLDAEKTIFVWTDFSCPYCRRVHGELDRVLAERDDVRVVIKNFSIHGPLSDAPAKATIAAKLQDPAKAAALADMLMTREYYTRDDMKDQAKLAEKVQKNVMKFAAEAGLDTKQLETDMKGEVVAREMANVRDLAERFEITGTPFLIIGEEAFPGAIPAQKIQEALDK